MGGARGRFLAAMRPALVAPGLLAWPAAVAADEVWLSTGHVTISSDSGETVEMAAGQYADCDDSGCELRPLALAPAAPNVAGLLQGPALAPGGIAGQSLGLGAGTIAGAAAPAIGIGAVLGGLAAGLAGGGGESAGTTSTTFTTSTTGTK